LPPSRRTILFLFALLCLIWGSTWAVIAEGLRDLPPFTSLAARMLLAAGAMALLVRAIGHREAGAAPPRWLVLTMAGTNFSVSYAIIYWAETRVPSALVSLIWAVFPILVAFGSHLLLPGERLDGRRALGSVLAFGGVALLFAGDLRRLGPGAASAGLVLLLSPLVSAGGTLLMKKHGSGSSSLLLNRDALLVAAPLLFVFALLVEGLPVRGWTPRAILATLYLAVVGTTFTFAIWFWLLRHARVTALSTISYITPALATLIGALRGEPISVRTLPAGLAILGGVALVAAPARLRPRGDAVLPAAPPAEG
jgi:drug/metabolite transporter (DMT)-like permease